MDINDDGWIIGTGRRNGRPQGFLLIPFQAASLALSAPTRHTNMDKRIAGAVCLSAPAKQDTTFVIFSDSANADPHVERLVIRRGQRVGVFFVSTNQLHQNTPAHIVVRAGNTTFSTVLTLLP